MPSTLALLETSTVPCSKLSVWLNVMAYVCNPSIWEAKEEEFETNWTILVVPGQTRVQ